MIEHIKQIEKVQGIIQIGANSGQEVSALRNFTNNIILIEPIPQLYEILKTNHSDLTVLCMGLGSSNCEMQLYLSSNNGESSSVLKPINHPILYPWILFGSSIPIKIRRFDSITTEFNIDIKNFNVIVSDAQGYDLEAIKGFGDLINNIDLIIVEYINSNLYENNASLYDIQDYLNQKGYDLLYTFDENSGAGNAVFKKSK